MFLIEVIEPAMQRRKGHSRGPTSAQLRIAELADSFANSREAHELGSEPRYIAVFLQMMADLSWDLTERDGASFSPELARAVLDQLPAWSRTIDLREAPRMSSELRAFFRYAHRTERVDHAVDWLEVLAAGDIDDLLRITMATDERLRRR